MLHFVVNPVAADVLAPLGVRASADALMNKFWSYIYMGLVREGLVNQTLVLIEYFQ